jgi:hypothetical protein
VDKKYLTDSCARAKYEISRGVERTAGICSVRSIRVQTKSAWETDSSAGQQLARGEEDGKKSIREDMQQLSESVSDSQLLCPLCLSFGISFAHSQLVLFSIDQFSSGQVIGVLFIMWKKEVGNFAVQRLFFCTTGRGLEDPRIITSLISTGTTFVARSLRLLPYTTN